MNPNEKFVIGTFFIPVDDDVQALIDNSASLEEFVTENGSLIEFWREIPVEIFYFFETPDDLLCNAPFYNVQLLIELFKKELRGLTKTIGIERLKASTINMDTATRIFDLCAELKNCKSKLNDLDNTILYQYQKIGEAITSLKQKTPWYERIPQFFKKVFRCN